MGKAKLIGVLGLWGFMLALVVVPVWGVTESATTREFEIIAQQYSYSPNVIRVNQGDQVKITLYSIDVMHGLAIDDYPVALQSWVAKTDSVEFVADQAGKFRMRCTVVCGAMHPYLVGELIVTPYTNLPISWALTLVVTFGTVGLLAWPGAASRADATRSWRLSLTRIGWVQSLVKNRWLQSILIWLGLFFFVLILLAAFFGSPVGNANFAIIYLWIVWWATLNFFLIPISGRLWCSICPLPLPGQWLEHLNIVLKGQAGTASLVRKLWPQRLRNSWLQNILFLGLALFSAIIMTRPVATGVVLTGLLVVAFMTAWLYGQRVFCRYLCPVSGFIGAYSMVAPVAVGVQDAQGCRTDQDKECLLACEAGAACPWTEHPGNQNCNAYQGMASACFKSSARENIALTIRPLGGDLFVANGRRLDAVYNVFIMLTCAIIYTAVYLGPWGWLKNQATIATIAGFLLYAVVFLLANLVLLPGLFYVAVWLGKGLAEGKAPPLREAFAFIGIMMQQTMALLRRQPRSEPAAMPNIILVTAGLPSTQRLFGDYSYALIPLGVAVWIGFTISLVVGNGSEAIRLLSNPFGWGWDLFGTAHYTWTLYAPRLIPILQAAVMLFGLAVSIAAAYRIAIHHTTARGIVLRSLTPPIIFMIAITVIIFRLML